MKKMREKGKKGKESQRGRKRGGGGRGREIRLRQAPRKGPDGEI